MLAITSNGDILTAFEKTPSADVPMTFACVVATFEGKVLFVFNPRRNEWELPSGNIKLDEAPEAAVIRELQEESGQIVETVQFVATVLLHLAKYNIPEQGFLYTCELKKLLPFQQNVETSQMMLWDLNSEVKGYVNGIAHKLALLTVH